MRSPGLLSTGIDSIYGSMYLKFGGLEENLSEGATTGPQNRAELLELLGVKELSPR